MFLICSITWSISWLVFPLAEVCELELMVESGVLYSFDCTRFPVLTFTAYALWKFSLICAYRKWLTCKFILLPVSPSGGVSPGGGGGALQPSARGTLRGQGVRGSSAPAAGAMWGRERCLPLLARSVAGANPS